MLPMSLAGMSRRTHTLSMHTTRNASHRAPSNVMNAKHVSPCMHSACMKSHKSLSHVMHACKEGLKSIPFTITSHDVHARSPKRIGHDSLFFVCSTRMPRTIDRASMQVTKLWLHTFPRSQRWAQNHVCERFPRRALT